MLLHKEPTVIYNIVINNGEYITLGDYINVKVATHNKGILLPVVQVSHVITDRVESVITLGSPELSIVEYISGSLE